MLKLKENGQISLAGKGSIQEKNRGLLSLVNAVGGRQDVRLVNQGTSTKLPAPIKDGNYPGPLVLLSWPTACDPEFRICPSPGLLFLAHPVELDGIFADSALGRHLCRSGAGVFQANVNYAGLLFLGRAVLH